MSKKNWGKSLVPPGDEKLFYRDVVALKSKQVVASSKLMKLAKGLGITLSFYPEDKNIATTVPLGTISLTSDKKDNQNSYSLNRHLRNAFCHLNIIVEGENCYLRDSRKDTSSGKTQTTMTGCVNYDSLKKLIVAMKV